MSVMVGFEINDQEFEEIRRLVYTTAGITLNDSKRALVVARLSKRLRHHGLSSFHAYCKYLRKSDADGSEMRELVNCITTNKTEFFREPHHFDWLRRVIIPEVKSRAQASGVRKVRIWSAGCSTGQEPYSIAMVLAEELGLSGWDVRILASDIDTNVLKEADEGAYDDDAIVGIPEALQHKYLERDGSKLRIAAPVRQLVTFRRVNLIEPTWSIRARFDVIFCRNVTIYFDQETQERLYERFVKQLEPHGYLVSGHSENLHWLNRLLVVAGPTVYRPAGSSPKRMSRRPSLPSPGRRQSMRVSSRRPPVLVSLVPGPPVVITIVPPPPPHEVAIQSGGFHATGEPTIVRTVLGSCVAACIYDPDKRVGGMNHFMLPHGCATDWVPTRFGTHAMEALLAELKNLGADRSRLRAKIFGGVHVLRTTGGSNPIPDDNVAFVRKFLVAQGIPVEREKVGGDLPMMLRFETHTGRAFVRLVERTETEAEAALRSESRYQKKLDTFARESESSLRAAKEVV
jgi:chemotaxis protein methyltransferase CheR